MMDFSFLTSANLKAKEPASKNHIVASKKQPLHYQVGEYQLVIKPNKRRKSIALKLQNQQPILAVPGQLSSRQLAQLLHQHHDWLATKLEQFMPQQVNRFQALPEQSFEFKGQNIRCLQHDAENLQVNLEQGVAKFMKHSNDCIEQQQMRFQQLQQWFISAAESYLQSKLDFYAEKMGLEYRSMQVKGYKSRWGSCYSDGRIQFNWRLMQAQHWVIDYVVVHELAHLKHPNHSKAFWQLVERHYPKTAQAKQQLKQHGARWIDFLQN